MTAADPWTLLQRLERGPLIALPNWPRASRLEQRGHVERTDFEGDKPGPAWRCTWRITDAGRRALAFHRRPGGEGGAPGTGPKTGAVLAA